VSSSIPSHHILRRPLFALVLAALFSCGGDQSQSQYHATIQRTSYGIPHITADDWGSLGFGEGYAAAEDHFCSIADLVVRARGQRARYFGAGENNRHLISDMSIEALGIRERAAQDIETFPEDLRSQFDGYVAGFNRYFAETGVENVPGWCRGQSWVTEIEVLDLVSYGRVLFMVSSNLGGQIVGAEPPGTTGEIVLGLTDFEENLGASNGWAIGRDRSETGRGMLVANPHYPWVGANRFWEKHLVIPGELDTYGAGLLGYPGVLVGFNNNIAWTHTVSAGKRTTLYRVPLKPGDPTTYLFDGEERAMDARDITIQVLEDDGSLADVTRTVYSTHHGPVLELPGFEWTEDAAFAVRDVNIDNNEAPIQWLAMQRAGNMDDFQKAHEDFAGMPWVNTISTSSDGRAWYADASGTPSLSAEAAEAWLAMSRTDGQVGDALARGWVLLNGGDSRFEWVDHASARDPGVLPFSRLPQLERSDYVFNANDSYWLANASELLEGLDPILATEEGTPRSPRTRMNALVLSDVSPDGPSGPDGRWSLDELADAAWANRSLTAELLSPSVAELCEGVPGIEIDGRWVSLDEACGILAAFDGTYDTDSRGAVLWREFITQFPQSDLWDEGALWAVGFDPTDPVGTPHTLVTGGKTRLILENLARAVGILEAAGFPLDVPLGELQHNNKNGGRIPVHGGYGSWEGITNAIGYGSNGTTLEPDPPVAPLVAGSRSLRADGYPINMGTSFVMALAFTDDGPRAVALLTLSQSGDPESPHFTDQTLLFSEKRWRPILFRRADIEADAQFRSYEVTGGAVPPTDSRQ
jgi:acyl-homoserine-lactone acylase